MNPTFSNLFKPSNPVLNNTIKPPTLPGLKPMVGVKPNPIFNQTPNPIQVSSKARPDKILNLISRWNYSKTRPISYLEKLFEDADFGGILNQEMSSIFPLRRNSASQEILKKKNVCPELASPQFGDLFNSISCSLNICIGSVYEILEPKFLAFLQKQPLNWVFQPESQVLLEKVVSQKWHEDRLRFLRLRNEILDHLNNPGGDRTNIILSWIKNSSKKRPFLESLVADFKVLVNLKSANFSESKQFNRCIAKIK